LRQIQLLSVAQDSESLYHSSSFESQEFMSISTFENESEKLTVPEQLIKIAIPTYSPTYRKSILKKIKNAIRIPPNYIISYKNPFKDRWDIFIVLLALVNCLVVPLEISIKPKFMDNLAYPIIKRGVDAVFFLDMLLMCITSFQDKKGTEVTNSNQIIPMYVMSFRFVIDVLAILGNFIEINLLSFLKMLRITRIDEIISRANLPHKIKAGFNLIKYAFYLCLYLHLLGCLWFGVCLRNANSYDSDGFNLTWIPPTFYVHY